MAAETCWPPLPDDIGTQLIARCRSLSHWSEEPDRLTRCYLTPEHAQVNTVVGSWMAEAGMRVRTDAVANLIGRYEGVEPHAPVLLLGSHLDTVRDAGLFDGMLGVVTAIAVVETLAVAGIRLDHAVEVIAFGDEEGTRFGAGLLGSRAIAGRFDPALLDLRDAAGISLREAFVGFGLNPSPSAIATAARTAGDLAAYLELHIEQGPVLEQVDMPVGIVTAIQGATRLEVRFQGQASHAGTVPMTARRDALAAASEAVLAVESICGARPAVVGTVGRLQVTPGAVNVIPGGTVFSIDVRSPQDADRHAAVAEVTAAIDALAARRGMAVDLRILYEAAAVPCAPRIIEALTDALPCHGYRPVLLPSGAGHDAMVMAKLCDAGMIFVRCKDGISHNPAESVTAEDAAHGARALYAGVQGLTEPRPAPSVRRAAP